MSKLNTELCPEKDREIFDQIPRNIYPLLNGFRVLVVDDNEDCLCMVKFILEEYLVEVKTAISANEAIEVIEMWNPDVLISDIGMPDKDGYWLIRTIRNFEALRSKFFPAIALTSYAYPEDCTKALDAGFQEVIFKPFDPDQLIAMVVKLAVGIDKAGLRFIK
ncbi:MAG: response regulator [Nostoc sp.]